MTVKNMFRTYRAGSVAVLVGEPSLGSSPNFIIFCRGLHIVLLHNDRRVATIPLPDISANYRITTQLVSFFKESAAASRNASRTSSRVSASWMELPSEPGENWRRGAPPE